MTPELLKTELARAEDAELESEDQLRNLTDLIDKACSPDSIVTGVQCAKIVAAALALNERLRTRTSHLRTAVRLAEMEAKHKLFV